MLGLKSLIIITILNGIFAVYLYAYSGDISFKFLYTYFFGTLIVFGAFLSNLMALIIYAIYLKKSDKSTHEEIVFSKILLWIISVILLVCIIMYFVNFSIMDSDEYKNEQYIKHYMN